MKQLDISEKRISSKLPINKGVELILGGGLKSRKTRPVFLRFDRMISFLKREVRFTFEFSLSIKKKKTARGGALWKR